MTKELLQQALDALDKSIIFANSQGIGGWQPTVMACHEAKDAIKQALAQQEPPNPWAEAVIEQLVIHHIYRKEHDADPRKAIRDLFCISNAIVLDPLVSKPAQDLVDRGRKEAQQEQYPLPDSLYPGSKDWQAGSYKERVEWLHLMYESAKQEVARLESQQEQLAQEPKCNPHPKAPHGFMRNSSHSNDRYVCECERWEPYEAGRAAGRQEAFDELDAPPTQPALSDDRQKKV